MNILEKAIEIAKSAHEGQKDKAGKDYILLAINEYNCR
jgi:(p)ppGpp synthase/HD superfamily hydrolase